jgi:hypothetical protein
LYRLVEAHYDDVKGLWEGRFERRYGFWRGFVDEQVRRYLKRATYTLPQLLTRERAPQRALTGYSAITSTQQV